ncbi:MAG: hypothetical protein IPG66_10195 [Hydrogenophilales bacterium]|nr:hypothetical protein [Hydrogenophilales bacterium]
MRVIHSEITPSIPTRNSGVRMVSARMCQLRSLSLEQKVEWIDRLVSRYLMAR